MSCKCDKIKLSPELDRRVKLLPSDKEEIRRKYEKGYGSLSKIAREYGVSKSTILLTVNKKSKKRNDEYIKQNWKKYHSREKLTEATKNSGNIKNN